MPQEPTGIEILETSDRGPFVVESFAMLPGEETAAADYLLDVLGDAEVVLKNGEDEGGEGCTTLRCSEDGFEAKNGGHGWQGDWKGISLANARSRIIELAVFNRGEHWSTQGSIVRPRA